jgi:4a-hydroxytetrahydrobiopterin dehydratase
MAILDAQEVRVRLSGLPGWSLEDGALTRQFTFHGFPEVVAYLVRLGFAAEAADHHPDIVINYRRVKLAYSTHSEGGLTGKDFDQAGVAGQLAQSMGGE